MKKFFEMLTTRGEEIDSQLLDTLLCFTDFPQFKELMLDHLRFKKKTAKTKTKKGKAPPVDEKKEIPVADSKAKGKEKFEPSLDDRKIFRNIYL